MRQLKEDRKAFLEGLFSLVIAFVVGYFIYGFIHKKQDEKNERERDRIEQIDKKFKKNMEESNRRYEERAKPYYDASSDLKNN